MFSRLNVRRSKISFSVISLVYLRYSKPKEFNIMRKEQRIMKSLLKLGAFTGGLFLLASCGGKMASEKTGWNYNDPDNGGFEVAQYIEQDAGPGLVLIEGGTFVMGATEQNITHENDNFPRRVTVSSFYMDETEVANVHYREYVYWLTRVFGESNPEIITGNLPDTTVWRKELGYNEPYVENYFRHPAYNYYPVVGVSWVQANDYCVWRTDRVNEKLMVDEGFIEFNPNQFGQENFNTEAYLAGLYQPQVRKQKESLSPTSEYRNISREDGILQPSYRLPTEAEWEYASMALVGNSMGENINDRKIFPWSGHSMRNPRPGNVQGEMLANFKRTSGDYMGVAGKLNDNAAPTAPVISYLPNDYGLYNMAGNVNEWVLDVYRPLSLEDFQDFNSYRGNVYNIEERDVDGYLKRDSLGRVVKIEDIERYETPDVIDYLDDDEMYSEDNSLVNNQARVYKGGGWRDMPYWLSPGTRRYLDETKASDDLGFRCAMIRVGSPTGQ